MARVVCGPRTNLENFSNSPIFWYHTFTKRHELFADIFEMRVKLCAPTPIIRLIERDFR